MTSPTRLPIKRIQKQNSYGPLPTVYGPILTLRILQIRLSRVILNTSHFEAQCYYGVRLFVVDYKWVQALWTRVEDRTVDGGESMSCETDYPGGFT